MKKVNRPQEGDELYLPGQDKSRSTVKALAGESLTQGNWLIYDSVGMPREIVHDTDRWRIIG